MTAVAMPPRSVSRAVAMALLCHGVFGVAVGSMAVSLATGMRHGLGPLSGASAWLANALLVAQFPLVHSWLLGRGRGWLAKLSLKPRMSRISVCGTQLKSQRHRRKASMTRPTLLWEDKGQRKSLASHMHLILSFLMVGLK